jgi:flagellin FlaB
MKNTNMKNNNTQEQDTMAAIGIGAMIVFIALILVAAVAAAVIIQTAEKLQQNAQSTGEDTTDEMSGKVQILNVFVNDGATSYEVYFRLAAGSDDTADEGILWQVSCDDGAGAFQYIAGNFGDANGDVVNLGDSTETDVDDVEAGVSYRFTLDATNAIGGGNDCGPDALFNNNVKATLYIHVVGGGTTYDILKVNDATEGAVVV